MTNLYCVKVALPIPAPQLFDYLWPFKEKPLIGIRVKVPLRNKEIIGLVLDITSEPSAFKLKPVLYCIDTTPILPPSILTLCGWASQYYHYPIGEVLFSALPKKLKQGNSFKLSSSLHWRLITDDISKDSNLLKGHLQKRCFELLIKHKVIAQSALKQFNLSTKVLKALEKKGLVESFKLRENYYPSLEKLHPLHTLNDQQNIAFENIKASFGKFQPFLLFGITGSGKTEVYLHLIKEILDKGQQALLLVPEIGLTPQTLNRFRQCFTQQLAIFHSGITPNEQLDAWFDAASGEAKLIIGTRSAIFIPMPHLKLIIVDEEHDNSFKQQGKFSYSARDLAIVRAQQVKIPVVLGSATPSTETFHNVQKNRYQSLVLSKRAGIAELPIFKLIDLRNQLLEEGLSKKLINDMQLHLSQGNQVLLFLNRRGFAPLFLCRGCGWAAKCHRCSSHLTAYVSRQKLLCKHCGSERNLITQCPECGLSELKYVGFGTERIETILKKHFLNFPIVRIDSDSTRKKGSLNQFFTLIQEGQPLILIGTQMIAKGHHFPKVTLVGILGADNGLYSNDYRACERLGQTITQVAGRAGRVFSKGEVLIQTHNPNHSLLKTLISQPYQKFLQELLTEREMAYLPPFSHQALFHAEASQMQKALGFLQNLKTIFLETPLNGIEIFGPIPALMEKKLGRYRAHLILQSTQKQILHRFLNHKLEKIYSDKTNQKARWWIEIDPYELI